MAAGSAKAALCAPYSLKKNAAGWFGDGAAIRKMAGGFGDAGAQAADLALRIGSKAADAASFVVELGEELPFISPVLKTLVTIRDTVGTVRSNREELRALEERCTYVTACVVVKRRQNSRSEIDVTPLDDCVKAVWKFVERGSRRGRVSRLLKASSDKDEIAALNARVDRLTGDLGLAGVAILEGKADNMKAMLVSFPPPTKCFSRTPTLLSTSHRRYREFRELVQVCDRFYIYYNCFFCRISRGVICRRFALLRNVPTLYPLAVVSRYTYPCIESRPLIANGNNNAFFRHFIPEGR